MADHTAWVMPGKISSKGTHYILLEHERNAETTTTGALIVFVHGIGSYHYHMQYLASALWEKGFNTLCYDNLGMGFTAYPETGEEDPSLWNGSGHVKQLHDLMEELQLNKQPYFVCGHSMGGAITTLYAAKYPSEVNGIILLSPSGVQSPLEGKLLTVSLLRNLLPSCFMPQVRAGLIKDSTNIENIRNFGDFMDKASDASEACSQAILRQHQNNKKAIYALFNCARYFPLYDCHAAVSSIGGSDVVVLLLHGEQDKTVHPVPTMDVWREALEGKLPGETSVELVPGAHAFHLEYPEETSTRIAQFIRQVMLG